MLKIQQKKSLNMSFTTKFIKKTKKGKKKLEETFF